MDYPQAHAQLLAGASVRRACWAQAGRCLTLAANRHGRTVILDHCEFAHRAPKPPTVFEREWIARSTELLAADWETAAAASTSPDSPSSPSALATVQPPDPTGG
jgi:hypothetical protein